MTLTSHRSYLVWECPPAACRETPTSLLLEGDPKSPMFLICPSYPQERLDGSTHTGPPPTTGRVDSTHTDHTRTTHGPLRLSGSGSEASFGTTGGSPLDRPTHGGSHVSRSSQKDKSPYSEEGELTSCTSCFSMSGKRGCHRQRCQLPPETSGRCGS